ncbi:DUF4097 family beta strand repeat-containing protein [Amycolatopsis magusensis]|uniref:DUF4097 family beta strand repeat-containing protein n=1 Tax=Amycolatopsis magusensis TaxID=882444 RepID=UPI0037A641C1
MPVFETPQPITATLEIGVGEVRLSASDRTDTLVEVHPTDPSDESDVKAASQTRVDYANGRLRVTSPKYGPFDFSKKSRSVIVTVELPSGSRVRGDLALGHFHGTGRLGECRVQTAAGHVRLDRTGQLWVKTAAGHVEVGHVEGDAEISTGSGRVSLGEVDGTSVVKNSNGHTKIHEVSGQAKVRAANGDISVDRAGAGVDAESSNGSIVVGEASQGLIVLTTSLGDLEVGIAGTTTARLELDTGLGRVRNSLPTSSTSGNAVDVRAHTKFGDITVRSA